MITLQCGVKVQELTGKRPSAVLAWFSAGCEEGVVLLMEPSVKQSFWIAELNHGPPLPFPAFALETRLEILFEGSLNIITYPICDRLLDVPFTE